MIRVDYWCANICLLYTGGIDNSVKLWDVKKIFEEQDSEGIVTTPINMWVNILLCTRPDFLARRDFSPIELMRSLMRQRRRPLPIWVQQKMFRWLSLAISLIWLGISLWNLLWCLITYISMCIYSNTEWLNQKFLQKFWVNLLVFCVLRKCV